MIPGGVKPPYKQKRLHFVNVVLVWRSDKGVTKSKAFPKGEYEKVGRITIHGCEELKRDNSIAKCVWQGTHRLCIWSAVKNWKRLQTNSSSDQKVKAQIKSRCREGDFSVDSYSTLIQLLFSYKLASILTKILVDAVMDYLMLGINKHISHMRWVYMW